MSDIPEIIEGEVPKGTPRVDRKYLEVPQDEVPIVDPSDPRRATGRPVKEVIPELLHIMVNMDSRPLLEAVNEAVRSNDIQKVISVLRNARIEAEQTSQKLITATWRVK